MNFNDFVRKYVPAARPARPSRYSKRAILIGRIISWVIIFVVAAGVLFYYTRPDPNADSGQIVACIEGHLVNDKCVIDTTPGPTTTTPLPTTTP